MERLLKDLVNQTEIPPLEILVCDDGSAHDTVLRVRRVCENYGAALITKKNDGFRPGKARNLGIAFARHDLVVFLDDDVRVMPDFIASHWRIHRHQIQPLALIGPRLYVRPDQIRADIHTLQDMSTKIRDDRESKYRMSFRSSQLERARAPWKLCYTCNLSVPLREVRSIGGFDESFVGYGLEDNEFGYRLFKAGVKFACSDKIPVFHEIEKIPNDPYKRATAGTDSDFNSYTANARRFITKHGDDPEVKRIFRDPLGAIETFEAGQEKANWGGYKIDIW